jgi:hypothetical protein
MNDDCLYPTRPDSSRDGKLVSRQSLGIPPILGTARTGRMKPTVGHLQPHNEPLNTIVGAVPWTCTDEPACRSKDGCHSKDR